MPIYTKHFWQSGDLITAELLNSLENGIYTQSTDLDSFKNLFGNQPFLNKTILPNNTDLNTVLNSGWYILESSYTYVNYPSAFQGEGSLLLVYAGTTAPAQLLFSVNTGIRRFYTRSGRSNSFTNRDWVNMLDDPNNLKNVLILSSCDLNNLSGNIFGILTDDQTYTHVPIVAGLIFNFDFSARLSIQICYEFTTAALFYRAKTTTWKDWQSLTPEMLYRASGKYVAFGDSLMWGSVWNPTNTGTNGHQVKDEWRIPTRIALATGMIRNYSNQAIGGIGYLKEQDGQNLIGQITTYASNPTFSDVELVTIMAGANDKFPHPLGTYSDSAATETVCGAIRNIIQTITTNNPKTQIVIIQPLPSGVDGNTQNVWSTIPDGAKWSMNQFDEQVSQLCHNEHIGYVNWWESVYCRNWKNAGYAMSGTVNYTHPTSDYDYCILGDFIAGKISALFKGLN